MPQIAPMFWLLIFMCTMSLLGLIWVKIYFYK